MSLVTYTKKFLLYCTLLFQLPTFTEQWQAEIVGNLKEKTFKQIKRTVSVFHCNRHLLLLWESALLIEQVFYQGSQTGIIYNSMHLFNVILYCLHCVARHALLKSNAKTWDILSAIEITTNLLYVVSTHVDTQITSTVCEHGKILIMSLPTCLHIYDNSSNCVIYTRC